MTKIIVEPRVSGKTTKAIIESVKNGYPILTSHKGMAQAVENTAKRLGVLEDMPKPLTFYEFMNREQLDDYNPIEGLIIDEGLILLQHILKVPIHMITISDKEKAQVPDDAITADAEVVEEHIDKTILHLSKAIREEDFNDEKVNLTKALAELMAARVQIIS